MTMTAPEVRHIAPDVDLTARRRSLAVMVTLKTTPAELYVQPQGIRAPATAGRVRNLP